MFSCSARIIIQRVSLFSGKYFVLSLCIRELQQNSTWPAGVPMTFQKFMNYNFGEEFVSGFYIGVQKIPESILYRTYIDDCNYRGSYHCYSDSINMGSLKKEKQKMIHPIQCIMRHCTLMLLTNLAEVEWVSIGCTKPLLSDVLCTISDTKNDGNQSLKNMQLKMCSITFVAKGENCYLFHWFKKSHDRHIPLQHTCWAMKMEVVTTEETFNYLLVATREPITPLLFPYNVSHVHQLQCIEYVSEPRHSIIWMHDASGFYACSSPKHRKIVGSHLFLCFEGSYISGANVCNNMVDCPHMDSSDESCNCNHSDVDLHSTCKIIFFGSKATCSYLYYMSANRVCSKFILHTPSLTDIHISSIPDKYICQHGAEIHAVFADDLISDCGPLSEDEPALTSLLKTGTFKPCKDPNQIPCWQGHSKCFDVFDICIFRLDQHNSLAPCRNGGHLENCTKFECNTFYKCPQSYCIQWELVCNNKWDCPSGSDESICSNKDRCFQMFKCKATMQMCLHVGNVCDGYQNCPFGDDEVLCQLNEIECVPTCHCLALAMTCMNNTLSFTRSYPHISLSILFCNIALPALLSDFSKVIILNLVGDHVSQLCDDLAFPNGLLLLDISFNLVTQILQSCLKDTINLQIFLGNNNLLDVIETHSFANLPNLKYVNLSNNQLKAVPQNVFSAPTVIKVISILNIPTTEISELAFKGLETDFVETTDYHLCCIVQHNTRCQAMKPWYKLCSDLLINKAAKIGFGFVSILVVLLSCASILCLHYSEAQLTAFIMNGILVSVSDIWCGVYMGILWVADISQSGKFMVVEEAWRSSSLCFIAFGISLYFNILSPVVLLFLAVSRLMVVLQPTTTQWKRTTFISKCLSLVYGVLLCVSAFIALLGNFIQHKLPTNFCVPFVDPTKSDNLLATITWLILLFHLAVSLAIIVAHCMLVINLKKSQTNVAKLNTRDSDALLILQLVILSTSNVLCWVSSNSIYVTVMSLSRYPLELIMWAIAGATPLNSIVSPVVFIFTGIRKVLRERKGIP